MAQRVKNDLSLWIGPQGELYQRDFCVRCFRESFFPKDSRAIVCIICSTMMMLPGTFSENQLRGCFTPEEDFY